jgi:hypothetical protein
MHLETGDTDRRMLRLVLLISPRRSMREIQGTEMPEEMQILPISHSADSAKLQHAQILPYWGHHAASISRHRFSSCISF